MSFPQLRSGILNPLAGLEPAVPAYVLSAEAGSFVWTGADVSLRVDRKLTAEAGSFTWIGAAATLSKGVTLTASGGSFTWSGGDASLRFDRKLTADAGAFSIAGADANFLLSGGPVNISISYDWERRYPRAFHPALRKPIKQALPVQAVLFADSGSFIITDGEADLRIIELRFTWEREVAKPRPFAPGRWGQLSNQPQGNLYKPVQAGLTNYSITASGGSFTWSGSPTGLLYHRVMPAESTSFTISGGTTSQNLRKLHDTGSYVITGTPVAFTRTYVLTCAAGSYAIAGTDINLILTTGDEVFKRGRHHRRRGRHRNMWWLVLIPRLFLG